MYKVVYAKQAKKDFDNIKYSALKEKVKTFIEIIKENPYQIPPPYEKLSGDMSEFYSRRINIQHRLVYQIFEEEKTVKILSMWSHYENIKKILEEDEEYGGILKP